jgi:hypothetical protein
MTEELHAAWRLAEAINKVDALKAFSINAGLTEMDLSWGCGNATTGYKELRLAMGQIVSERWTEIRDEAIRRADLELQEARDAMRATLPRGS